VALQPAGALVRQSPGSCWASRATASLPADGQTKKTLQKPLGGRIRRLNRSGWVTLKSLAKTNNKGNKYMKLMKIMHFGATFVSNDHARLVLHGQHYWYVLLKD
jgi:hypothetical protein